MNRPKLNDTYLFTIKDKELLTYILEIGHYCDELEEENSKLYCLKDKRFEELTKALDNACELLSGKNCCFRKNCSKKDTGYCQEKMCNKKETLKGWLLKDEQTKN